MNSGLCLRVIMCMGVILRLPQVASTILEPEGYHEPEHIYIDQESPRCPHFPGKNTLKLGTTVKIIHLDTLPTYSFTSRQKIKEKLPAGTLYGSAIIEFSDPIDSSPTIDDIEISNENGLVLSVLPSQSNCSALVDFIVPGKCKDGCLPAGACIGIRKGAIAEAGEVGRTFPTKSDCIVINDKKRAHCTSAKLYASNMGIHPSGLPYSSDTHGILILSLSHQSHKPVHFTKEDFLVKAQRGAYLESVAPVDKHGAAFKIKANMKGFSLLKCVETVLKDDTPSFMAQIHHSPGTKAGSIQVCFIGGHKLEYYGIPYDGDEHVCLSYIKGKKPSRVLSVGLVVKQLTSPTSVCRLLRDIALPKTPVKRDDFSGYAQGGIWWIPSDNAKVTFLSGKAESSTFTSPVTADLYKLEQDGELKEFDEHISLPPELKHLADDLSGSKNRPKDIYKLLPQIFQGLDKDDFIALLELLNVDGSVNTRKAVDIMLSLGAPQSAIEQFKKLVYKLNGQLEADLILYAFDITDRKGRLHSPEKFLHLLTKLPARSKTHTLLNEYLDPKYQIEHIPDHALDVSVSGAGGSYHAEDLDAHSAAKFVDRFLSGSIAPQSSGYPLNQGH